MEVLGHVQLKVGRVGGKDAVGAIESTSPARWPQATPFALRS